MSVTAKNLIESKFAASGVNTEYTAPASTRTIIDKFTATNTDSSSQTVTVYVVPSAGSPGASNIIISALSIAAGECKDISALQNHILNSGDFIACLASVSSKVVIRSSGREVTT